jgi:hypothetical protein
VVAVKTPLCLQYQQLFDVCVGWKEGKEFATPMVQTIPAGAQPDLESMTFIAAKTYSRPELAGVQSTLATLAATFPTRDVWRAETRKILGLEDDKETC